MRVIYYGRIHKRDFEEKIISCLSSEDSSCNQVRNRLLHGGIEAPITAIRDRLEALSHFKQIAKSENSTDRLFLYRKTN